MLRRTDVENEILFIEEHIRNVSCELDALVKKYPKELNYALQNTAEDISIFFG
ncbi:MAG: hypothetical protein KBG42_09175 [Lachnospiraceae bacterium]|nr:hypothetical protein [Lachnospiraceae bacterium]